jgi:hypothetical protein
MSLRAQKSYKKIRKYDGERSGKNMLRLEKTNWIRFSNVSDRHQDPRPHVIDSVGLGQNRGPER